MYQSEFFQLNEQNYFERFYPNVISAYKIYADNSYSHFCNETEKNNYPDNTYAFIRCTQGKGKIYSIRNTFILDKNECLFLKFKDIEKYISKSSLWEYRWVNFYVKNTRNEFETGKIYKTPFSEKENDAFNKMLNYGKTYPLNSNYLNSLFTQYFYSVMLKSGNTECYSPTAQIKLIDEICSYIDQKIYSKILIDEVAAFFKISPRRLHQIFTKELSISPKKYIIKKKMEEGYKILVQTSTPINKIANMLAFSSPYHFTNEFKKTFGKSPRDIRKIQDE